MLDMLPASRRQVGFPKNVRIRLRLSAAVSLTARGEGTHVCRVQEFESALVAERLRHIVGPGSEQNLDRLQSPLAGENA
jgi:hypothetical protein